MGKVLDFVLSPKICISYSCDYVTELLLQIQFVLRSLVCFQNFDAKKIVWKIWKLDVSGSGKPQCNYYANALHFYV